MVVNFQSESPMGKPINFTTGLLDFTVFVSDALCPLRRNISH